MTTTANIHAHRDAEDPIGEARYFFLEGLRFRIAALADLADHIEQLPATNPEIVALTNSDTPFDMLTADNMLRTLYPLWPNAYGAPWYWRPGQFPGSVGTDVAGPGCTQEGVL